MDQTTITAAGAIDTFLLLLIGIGPKLALVPFVEITAPLDPAGKRQVLRKMLVTASAVAVALIVLGELLRSLLHFTMASLSIAGGVILLVLAVWMVLSPPGSGGHDTAGRDPMQLAQGRGDLSYHALSALRQPSSSALLPGTPILAKVSSSCRSEGAGPGRPSSPGYRRHESEGCCPGRANGSRPSSRRVGDPAMPCRRAWSSVVMTSRVT
jgi:hypothetical protein